MPFPPILQYDSYKLIKYIAVRAIVTSVLHYFLLEHNSYHDKEPLPDYKMYRHEHMEALFMVISVYIHRGRRYPDAYRLSPESILTALSCYQVVSN